MATKHDGDCTECEHNCPWQNKPIGAPWCQICDDHNETQDED